VSSRAALTVVTETVLDANGSNENTVSGFESPQALDTSSSAKGSAPTLASCAKAELLAGPVVLAQPPDLGASTPVARSASTESRTAVEAAGSALDPVKNVLTSAQAALSGGYRTVSASTTNSRMTVHGSPLPLWRSAASLSEC
jgi:hypothetical protein